MPSKVIVRGAFPAGPGQLTVRWKSEGKRTKHFLIRTALGPFFPDAKPRVVGWRETTFKVPRKARSFTFGPAQLAKVGAPLGSGRRFLFRMTAIPPKTAGKGKDKIKLVRRGYSAVQVATVPGLASQQTGAPLRFASFNIRLEGADSGTHSWANRAPKIAANVGAYAPHVVAMQELKHNMWLGGGSNSLPLRDAFADRGLGRYRLALQTPFEDGGTPGAARLVYDSDRLTQVTACDDQPQASPCWITHAGQPIASWSEFRVTATGERFLAASVHLTPGKGAAAENKRGEQALRVAQRLDQLSAARGGIPVIVGGDLNSFQTQDTGLPGHPTDVPHTALLNAGYYDASAAVVQRNLQYGTANHFEFPQRPSKNGFGPLLDVVMMKGMRGSDRFENVLTTGSAANYASDHNMVVADLRLPAGG